MAITVAMREEVSQLYVALFGRAPDGEGLGYWVSLRDAGQSMTQIANTMYATTPARAYFPSFYTNEEIISSFYTNVLGRTADAEGLAYWTAKLNAAGATPGSVITEMISVVANYTGTDAAGLTSQALFNNKVEVAQYYGEKNGTVDGATTVLSSVTATASTVTAAKTAIDSGAVVGINQGGTYTLTTDIDTFNGTSGNDTFIGDNGTTSAADQVSAGAGTDVLKLYDTVTTPTYSGVEQIYLNSPDGDMNISAKTEVTSLTVENQVTEDDNDFTIGTGQAVTLKTITEGATPGEDLDILSAAAVTSVSLTVDTVGTSTTDVDVDIEGGGVTTLNLTASGAASYFSLENTGAVLATINIAGDKVATIDLDTDSNAGGLTNNTTAITVTNTAGAVVTTDDDATKNITFTGGTGDDTVYFGTEFNSSDAATGGSGTDTIGIADGADLTTTSGAKATGFEKLSVKGGTGTYDMDYLSGITQVIASGGAGAITITDLAVGADVKVIANLAGGALTINQKDAGAGSPDDTLSVTIDKSTAVTTTQNIDVNDIETVTLNTTSSGTSITHTITNLIADEATSVKVVASTAGATFAALNAAAMVLFDASTSTKAVSLTTTDTFTSTSGVAFKGGAGSDTFNLIGVADFSSTANDATVVLNGGAGGDAYVLAADDGTTTGNGHTDGEAYTFQFAAGDSVSTSSGTYGYDTTKMDEISGIDSTTAFVAATDAAGSKFTLDTEVTASNKTFSTTAVTFGTTTVSNAYDFYIFDNNANTANTAYVYQDTDGDLIIEAGEFGILLTGTAQFVTGDFTVTSGNLVFATS